MQEDQGAALLDPKNSSFIPSHDCSSNCFEQLLCGSKRSHIEEDNFKEAGEVHNSSSECGISVGLNQDKTREVSHENINNSQLL